MALPFFFVCFIGCTPHWVALADEVNKTDERFHADLPEGHAAAGKSVSPISFTPWQDRCVQHKGGGTSAGQNAAACKQRDRTTAKAPRWVQFISEITGLPLSSTKITPRPALASYLQRGLGYCQTGSTAEHKMFIAVGEGSNGKSVLLDLMQWIIGDYCETVAPEALMTSKHDADAERPTPGMRKLAGVRLAISSESKDGQKLDVALIKRHTGGGYLTARGLHENAFRFEITHKLWLMTNHKPALDNLDQAMRGRLHLIPFDMRWNRPGVPEKSSNIPDGDKMLPDKLKLEAAGILAWLVEGAVQYHKEGLEPPPEVANMTRTYFEDQDQFADWYQSYKVCAIKEGTLSSELFSSYRDWCVSEGCDASAAGTAKSFATKLTNLGIESRKLESGRYYGLRKLTADDCATDAALHPDAKESDFEDLV
jgi:putative DNA primase/helicase